ncbi:hypothetical protein AB0O91_34220 [Kitasatospora sp. NPDC089797]|uniref:hypothetical protein n=1 Tax=Kitasatospora sp. NPDC089797 TaxID=3155298 RepID=UPI003428C648
MDCVQLKGRSARARTLLLLPVAALLAAGCAGGPGQDDRAERRNPSEAPAADATAGQVRTDVDPLKRRFPELGELSATKWIGRTLGQGGGSGVPGPTDVSLDGIARIDPGTLATITGNGTWQEERIGCPVPSALAEETGGAESAWLHSDAFDRTVTRGRYTGSFYFDRQHSRVYFCTVNPAARTD